MGKPVYLVELTARRWPQYMRSGVPHASGSWMHGQTRVPVNVARTYRVTAKARRNAAANGTLFAGLALYDAAGAQISAILFERVAAFAVTPGTTWATYTGTCGAATATTFPVGTVSMSPLLILNYGATAGEHHCMELWIEDTAAAGVAISADRYMRNAAEWYLRAGNAPSFATLLSDTEAQTDTLRYATAAYMTWPSDTPAKTQYEARVMNPGLLRSELPSGFVGAVTSSYGEIVLNNSDGALGDLAYYGLDGQPFRLLAGHDELDYGGFNEVLVGTMQQATVDRTQVRIRLAGRDAALDRPLLSARYLGNNVLPAGLEGNAEMADKLKPLLVGRVYGLQPPCVNTARYIYQVTCGTVANAMPLLGVDRVWDAGVALTRGAAYSSQVDMETNAPAAGQYREWLAGGCFRIGTAPAGVVTCDADARRFATGYQWWWLLLHDLATNWAGVAPAEVQFNDSYISPEPDNWGGTNWTNNIDQTQPGVWVTEAAATLRDVAQQLVKGHGAWFGFVHWSGLPSNVAAKLGGEIFPPPCPAIGTRATYLNLDATNCLAIAGVADPGPGRGLPVWRVEMTYAPNSTVLTPSMAPSVSPLALGKQGVKDLSVYVVDSTVLTKHVQARAVVINTVEHDQPASMEYEAARLLALGRYPKLWFEVRVALAAVLDQEYRPRLGGYVALSFPTMRCMWQDGTVRNWGFFNVMTLEVNFAKNEVRMTLRQATEPSI